jgi:hypothetical protein
MWGTICHICGHDGATQADHLIDARGDVDLFFNPELLRPAHGGRRKCPVCGIACNQSRGRPGRKVVTPPGVASPTTLRRKMRLSPNGAAFRPVPPRVYACTREPPCYCRQAVERLGTWPSRCW